MHKTIRRLAATTLVAIAASLLGSLTAHAVNVDPNRSGSLTIHKHVQDEQNSSPGSPAGKPLAGIEFSVAPVLTNGVALDLATAEGWAKASTVIAGGTAQLPEGFTTGAPTKVVTGADGAAVAANLPLGLYLVTETGFGVNNVSKPAVPFWVTLPMPAANSTWDYDVDAYPKNELAAPAPAPTSEPTSSGGVGDGNADDDEGSGSVNTGIPGMGHIDPVLTLAGLSLIAGALLIAARRRRDQAHEQS